MPARFHWVTVALVLLVARLAPLGAAEPAAHKAAEGIEFFETHVRPLLVAHCYECHSAQAEEAKGGLLLDSKPGWEQGGDSGPAVVPGDVEASLLLSAVRYEDFEMPPRGKLSDEQIALLTRWVSMGAPDPRAEATALATAPAAIDFEQARQFWSFQLPRSSQPPSVRDTAWPRDAIDAYILAKQEETGLAPAADATNRAWLRRVTFDLTGLPPTRDELQSLQADESPEAREQVVDRLLASAAYGEHWGRHWLDLARYADSNGGDINLTFYNAWRYRNYVIDAFNRDKPFDLFLREQLAGDLMPYETPEQRAEQLTATGFLVMGSKMLSERDKEKLFLDVADEQLDTIGKVFMGLTLGCARCHDHKFDPIPTADYYAMAGILRSTETVFGIRMGNVNVSGWLEQPLPAPPELTEAVAKHQAETDRLSAALKQHRTQREQLRTQTELAAQSLLGIVVDDPQAERIGQWKESTHTPRYVGVGYVHDNQEEKGKKSLVYRPHLPATGLYEVRMAFAYADGRASNVPVVIRHADGEETLLVDQTKRPEVAGLFKKLGTFRFEAGNEGTLTIGTAEANGYVIADAVQFIDAAEIATNDDPAAQLDAAARVEAQVAELAVRITDLEKQLDQHKKQAPPKPPQAMSVRDRGELDDCKICIRGEVHNRGPAVPRGFLQIAQFASQSPVNPQQSGRLEMANWLSHPRHPLTARVAVNRIWHHLFGRGLVATVDNFGKLGQEPTHPELLDQLALDFIQSGWSSKQLIRRIVLSRTYGQSTAASDKALDCDPVNLLLTRQFRRRLTAEEVRDAILLVSGSLDRTAAESAVEGIPEQAVANSASQSGGISVDENTRRSVYLPLVRNDLPAMLTVMDLADPDVVTGRCAQTTVPTQSLMMLNSAWIRQRAGAAAASIVAAELSDEREGIRSLYESILARLPTEAELARAEQYLQDDVAGTPTASDEAAPSKAAWASLAQVLIASTEFLFLD